MVGCSPQNDPAPLLGTWYAVGSKDSIQYFEDGSFQLRGSRAAAGDYSFPDGEHVRYDLGGLAGTEIYKFEFIGEMLVLTDATNRSAFFSRTPPPPPNPPNAESIKAEISEILSDGTDIKVAITEFRIDEGRFPSSLDELDFKLRMRQKSMTINTIEVTEGGVIRMNLSSSSLRFENIADQLAIQFTPSADDGPVIWNCKALPPLSEYPDAVPAACW